MIRSVVWFILAVLICSFVGKKYINKECGFAIDFPATPESSIINYSDPFAYELKIFKYVPKENGANYAYEVRYTQPPKEVLSKLSKEEIHKMMYPSIGNAANDPSALLNKKILDSDQYYCEEYEIFDSKNQEYGYIRVYVIGNRMYQLFLVTTLKRDKNTSVDAFFNSFQIL